MSERTQSYALTHQQVLVIVGALKAQANDFAAKAALSVAASARTMFSQKAAENRDLADHLIKEWMR